MQKHRDRINDDAYEWRQEDEDKMHALFDERKHSLERAEFLEQVDNVIDDIDRQDRNDPRRLGADLRTDDPGLGHPLGSAQIATVRGLRSTGLRHSGGCERRLL